ncbi:MAG: hypothetical protein AB7N76_15335 [Planctomycetota bacterium]
MADTLAGRARRATGMDIESFAHVLGVPWKELARYEEGKGFESPLHEALFKIIAAAPKESLGALQRAQRTETDLARAMVRAVLALGKGPNKAVSMHLLKKALRFGHETVQPFPGATEESIKEKLYELDRLQHLEMQEAKNLSALSKPEKDACIRDAARGFLAYVAPGPKLPLKGKKPPPTRRSKAAGP